MKKIIFFASLKSLKKGVGSGAGSRSISQRYWSKDPDPHQNVTDPQHWEKGRENWRFWLYRPNEHGVERPARGSEQRSHARPETTNSSTHFMRDQKLPLSTIFKKIVVMSNGSFQKMVICLSSSYVGGHDTDQSQLSSFRPLCLRPMRTRVTHLSPGSPWLRKE
jgi:hypothetical protein